jgi:hypothetical protein
MVMKRLELEDLTKSQLPFNITNDSKFVRGLKWSGTVFGILSAISMAFLGFTHTNYQIYFYIGYVCGSSCWLIAGCILKDKPLIMQQGCFTIIDIIGIVTRWPSDWNF